MSDVMEEIVVTSFPKAENSDDHYCCCLNKTITICGKETDDSECDSYPDSVDCQECMDRAYQNDCPLLGPNCCKIRWETF